MLKYTKLVNNHEKIYSILEELKNSMDFIMKNFEGQGVILEHMANAFPLAINTLLEEIK